MKTQKNIFIAFLLNFLFAIFEFAGGVFTGSVAILSDAVHDLGDAATIGISYFLEKKSNCRPDETYTYGYGRFSVLGGAMTSLILLIGSGIVICNAITRIITPTPIHYDGMILFAVVGVAVNFCAALVTHKGDSLNQKAVNLHMLEDVLGWAVVLVGAVIMKFTEISLLDPLLSIGVAVFILLHAIKNLRQALLLFLERTPDGMDPHQISAKLREIPGVTDVHHIHLWSMDGSANLATVHLVTSKDPVLIKAAVRSELQRLGICHATLELEAENEPCCATHCRIAPQHTTCCHHH